MGMDGVPRFESHFDGWKRPESRSAEPGQDILDIDVSQQDGIELIGVRGYFEGRRVKMALFSNFEKVLTNIFAILNGDLVLDDTLKGHYPTYIHEYAAYYAMCKRDAAANYEQEIKELREKLAIAEGYQPANGPVTA